MSEELFQCPFTNKPFEYDPHTKTVHDLLARRAMMHPCRKCLGVRLQHEDRKGVYWYYSYQDTLFLASQLYYALQDSGFGMGDHVGVLSQNRPEWTILDLACSALGCILVPFYDTQSLEDFKYSVKLTEPKVIFTELVQLKKFGEALAEFGVECYVFDDVYLDRVYLADHSGELRFALPERVTCRYKGHDYYKQVDEIYVGEVQPTFVPVAKPHLDLV